MKVALRARAEGDEDVLFRVITELDSWEERSPSSPRAVPRPLFLAKLADGDYDADVDFVITADGDAVGRCTLMGSDPLTQTAEVGISLVAEARGRGVGTAAARLLVEFAFERRNLRRVHLVAVATNLAALASYRKVGFVEEGRRREHCWVRGEYVDEVLMGLLRADYVPA